MFTNDTTDIFFFSTGPFFGLILIIFLTALMILIYSKWRIFLFAVIVEIFSIVLGIQLITNILYIPLTPWLQLFFIFWQSALFIKISIDVYQYKG